VLERATALLALRILTELFITELLKVAHLSPELYEFGITSTALEHISRSLLCTVHAAVCRDLLEERMHLSLVHSRKQVAQQRL